MRITDDDLRRMVEGRTSEQRSQEWKPPFNWKGRVDPDRWNRERVIRGILAMSNTPGGGDLIVGIDEQKGTKRPVFTGLDDKQLQSFEDPEAIKDKVDSYCYTSVAFELAFGGYGREDGQRVRLAVFRVAEFAEIPSMCRKDGQHTDGKDRPDVLRAGDIYVRPVSGRASSQRCAGPELREIVELAADKGARRLEGRGWRRTPPEAQRYFKDAVADLEE